MKPDHSVGGRRSLGAFGLIVLGLALVVALSPVIPVRRGTAGDNLRTATEEYTVTFEESGLPSGTSWSVTMSGTTQSSVGSSIAFSEPSGTYEYTVGPPAGFGSPFVSNVTVTDASVTLPVEFAPPISYYPVSFMETGLTPGAVWSVTFAGAERTAIYNGTSSSITYVESNGTYGFTIGLVSDYSASPSTGEVIVNGASATETIAFTPTTPHGQAPNGSVSAGNLARGGGATVPVTIELTISAAVCGAAGVGLGLFLAFRRPNPRRGLTSVAAPSQEHDPPGGP